MIKKERDPNRMTDHHPMPHPQQTAPQVPPGYQLKRKRPFYKRVWFWLLVIVAVIVIAIVASVASAVDDAVNKPHEVTYSVTGNIAKVDISYFNSDGSNRTKQKTVKRVSLPWSKQFTIKGDMSLVSVDAIQSNILGKGGKLACKLTIDGKVVATDQSRGKAAMVDCTGTGYSGQ